MLNLIETFTDKYKAIGPITWILSVEYFVIQLIVARAWTTTYSLSHNSISDLGNSACGIYSGREVCSPLHPLMNISFIVLGLFMDIGAMFIYREFKRSSYSKLGFSLMAIAGLGPVLVGLFPENTVGLVHEIGAGLAFVLGNIAILILGLNLSLPNKLKVYSLASGSLGLIGVALLAIGINLGLGSGGIERLAAYPQTLWLIVFGAYMSRSHFKRSKKIL